MSPSADTRFRKGRSGNPAGRPRAVPQPVSAFDIIMDRTLTLTVGDSTRALTVDEALQYKTYQLALGGSRMAVRTVLKMIARREAALAAKAPKPHPPALRVERVDPKNAYDALILLGIAAFAHDSRWPTENPALLLDPWAVQAALDRRGLPALREQDKTRITHSTRDAQTLRWPNWGTP